jgi:hypothetical protein
MTYTASINENLIVEVLKDGVIYDRVGPWADIENATNFIETRLRTYEEADIARANGTALVEEFKENLAVKLKEKGLSNTEIDELLTHP